MATQQVRIILIPIGQGFVRGTALDASRAVSYPPFKTKRSPFSHFKTPPEIIRPAVMSYFRFPSSPRNVEYLLY